MCVCMLHYMCMYIDCCAVSEPLTVARRERAEEGPNAGHISRTPKIMAVLVSNAKPKAQIPTNELVTAEKHAKSPPRPSLLLSSRYKSLRALTASPPRSARPPEPSLGFPKIMAQKIWVSTRFSPECPLYASQGPLSPRRRSRRTSLSRPRITPSRPPARPSFLFMTLEPGVDLLYYPQA